MSLTVRDVKNFMENIAPVNLKENYDNVGLMVGDLNCEVTSILVSLDCTLDVIQESLDKNCNLILTHHPLLFKKPSSITADTLIGKKLLNLITNNINLYSAHTNLDSVEGGINDVLMKIMGFSNYTTLELSQNRKSKDDKSGIGRIAELDTPIFLGELCDKVKKILNLPYIRYAGEENMKVHKVAVINGSGQDYFYIAKKLGADCIITGDTTYHYVSDYNEEKIAIIDAGHFGTEWIAFKTLALSLKNKIKSIGFDNKVILSESLKDPYKLK